MLIAQVRAVFVAGGAVEQLAVGGDESVVLLEDQHRVTALGGVGHERPQAGTATVPLGAVAAPSVIDRGPGAADRDRFGDRPLAGLALVFHVQPALAEKYQPAQRPTDGVEVAGHDDAGDEEIATTLVSSTKTCPLTVRCRPAGWARRLAG
jgi:hypothetical protein